MAEPLFTRSLAAHPAPEGLSISLSEVADRGMLDLRGSADDGAFLAAIESVLGCSLPREPRTSSSIGAIIVLWLSIDQWLVLCPRAEVSRLAADLRRNLAAIHSLVVDMSDARTILRLEGEGVREVLMKGIPVDLTLPGYTPGTVRRVRFAEVAALIHIVAEDVIDLYVFRSHADYAWDWLLATAKEAASVRLFTAQPAPIA